MVESGRSVSVEGRRFVLGRWLLPLVVVALLAASSSVAARAEHPEPSFPPAPAPEAVEIKRLALPPRPNGDGVCEHPTGCIVNGQSGGFLPGSKVVSMMAVYEGSPEGSPYAGEQIVLLKADGTVFPETGEPWKCITCGTPAENKLGMGSIAHEPYPQPFPDGKRILAMTNIVECDARLDSPACTPDKVHVYPIRWNVTPDGSGPGGSMRELRLHPDGVHLGWNKLVLGPFGGVDPTNPAKALTLDQHAYFGRLRFNAAPTSGEPLAPRYELDNVWVMFNETDDGYMNGTFIHRDEDDPTKLKYTRSGAMGELRGFTGDGKAALGLCLADSNNIDICATDLTTGASRRLTADPSYTDPVAVSPDAKWTVALETRPEDRFMYIAGLPGVPPINQIASGGAVASGYKDGERRFFQPWLLDNYPERPGYEGQQLNACATPEEAATPGSVCDPNWGTRADPRWSPDGTKVVYYQRLVEPPQCPGLDPNDCPESTEPHGHVLRVMVAELTDRLPQPEPRIAPVADEVPWGAPYHPGDPDPVRSHIPTGSYTYKGAHSGEATVLVTTLPGDAGGVARKVSAVYRDYSHDGENILNGTESVHTESFVTTFHSALQLSGAHTGGRFTSPGGFTVSVLNAFTGEMAYAGYMTTIIDGRTYHPPLPTK